MSNKAQNKKTFCRICLQVSENLIHEVQEMMLGFNEKFVYMECSNCGCLQIEQIPPDMSRYYPAYYYSIKKTPDEMYKNFVKKHLVRTRDLYAIHRKGMIGRVLFSLFPDNALSSLNWVKPKKTSRVLDIGCGAGLMLYRLKNCGFGNILGVDQYIDSTIRYKNDVQILKAIPTELDLKSSWDVILFFHSFEHMPDPFEVLKYCALLLSPGGGCIIRTPTTSSYAWKYYGTNWVQLDAPRHFFIYSSKALAILAERCGFELINIVYDSTDFQFWGSELYLKNISLSSLEASKRNLGFFTPREMRIFRKRAKQLNADRQGDQAVFYLRKRSCLEEPVISQKRIPAI